MAPTLIIVPGFWEGPSPFSHLSTLLQKRNYPVQTLTLPSTGTTSPGSPSMSDDIAAIRAHLSAQVNSDKQLILILHSAGGFLGSSAMEGLSLKAGAGQEGGGVAGIIFVTAGVAPEGFVHGELPFAKVEGGSLVPLSPKKLFFNDLPDSEASEWAKKLQSQPARDWNGTVTYCGWREVPSVYVVCTKDACLPEGLQEEWARSAGSKIEKIEAGHMPHLSRPEELAELVVRAVEGIMAGI